MATLQVPRASLGTENVTTPRASVPVTVLVVLPFLSLIDTLPVAVERPFGVVIVTLYLPAFLLVGALAIAPATLLTLTRAIGFGAGGAGGPGSAGGCGPGFSTGGSPGVTVS